MFSVAILQSAARARQAWKPEMGPSMTARTGTWRDEKVLLAIVDS